MRKVLVSEVKKYQKLMNKIEKFEIFGKNRIIFNENLRNFIEKI